MKRLLFLGLTILISFAISKGRIINIPADFNSIQTGINSAQTGDTVLVAPGTYFEHLNFRSHNITLASHFILNPDDSLIESTVIDGNSAGSVIRVDSGQTNATLIEGFTLIHGSGSYGGGIHCHVSSPRIFHNIIRNNTSSFGGGIGCDTAACPIIEFNEIKNNTGSFNGGGIYCYNYSNAIIRNNIIIANSAWTG